MEEESLTLRAGEAWEAYWEKVGFEGSTGVYQTEKGIRVLILAPNEMVPMLYLCHQSRRGYSPLSIRSFANADTAVSTKLHFKPLILLHSFVGLLSETNS